MGRESSIGYTEPNAENTNTEPPLSLYTRTYRHTYLTHTHALIHCAPIQDNTYYNFRYGAMTVCCIHGWFHHS